MKHALVFVALLCSCGCARERPSFSSPTASRPAAASPEPAQTDAPSLHGKVLERLEVPEYTYLRIQAAQGEVWAAVPTSSVPVGAEVTITDPMPMRNFQSPSLKRTFSILYFGSDAGRPQPVESIRVARASGPDAQTIAEIYANKASLKDKTVSVRGRVVKVTDGVLDRTWVHLRDGSSAEGDLVITTTANVSTDEEITVRGVVHTDKNLGSGYSYPVLIENADITR